MEKSYNNVCNCGFGSEKFVEEGNSFYCSICSGEVKPSPPEGSEWRSEVKRKVLLVDDQGFYQNFVCDILSKRNLYVEIASSGLEAVRLITEDLKMRVLSQKNDGSANLSLVILDLGLPGLINGLQTLGVIKTIQPLLNIIILTSSPPEQNLLAQLKTLKANHYLKKTNKHLEHNLVRSVSRLI